MRYELHIEGRLIARFATTDAALARAREMLRQRADSNVEIRDAETGRPVMPAASASWREHLAQEVGF